jgi:hypothetical protein
LVFLSLIRCSSTLYWQVVPLLKCPVRACLRPHTCFSAPFSPFTRKAKGNKHTHNKTKHKKDIVFIVLEHSVARARNVEKKGRTRIQYAGHVKHEIREFALSLSIYLSRSSNATLLDVSISLANGVVETSDLDTVMSQPGNDLGVRWLVS